jgi:hypothetical protein
MLVRRKPKVRTGPKDEEMGTGKTPSTMVQGEAAKEIATVEQDKVE